MRSTRPTAKRLRHRRASPRATVGWLAAARKGSEKHRDLERCRTRPVDRGFAGRHASRDVHGLRAAGFRSDPDRPAQRDVPLRRPQLTTDRLLSPATAAVGAKRSRATDPRMSVETADARLPSFAIRVQSGEGKSKLPAAARGPAINAKVDPSFAGNEHSHRMSAIGKPLRLCRTADRRDGQTQTEGGEQNRSEP